MTKQIATILFIWLVPLNTLYGQTANTREMLFSVAELKSDIKYLKKKLENNHPGLYLYTSKSIIDKVFDSLENSIAKPLSELEFYKHIAILSSIIKDGHTIILPGTRTTEYYNETGRFLPYHFTILNNKLYVDMVYTNDPSILAGTEITGINKIDASDVIKQLSERQVRDGNNLTYPGWILSNYFRQYYSFVFGHPETFAISFKINGQTNTATINALKKQYLLLPPKKIP
jgi:hypothetical protein